MGLFKKKKKTTIEKFHETVIQHKIIKLTYLQTLGIAGGVGDLSSVAGETEAIENQEIDLSSNSQKLFNLATDVISGGPLDFLGLVSGGINSAFGKSVTNEVTSTLSDSGWRVVKTWLQPEFDKIRYALGIRELTVAQFRYEKVSEVVSQPWTSPKDITKVTLLVDQFTPPQFPPGQDYLQYYVRPELPNADWIRINPIGDRTVFDGKGSIVPRIVNFNTERPATARLEDAYITTDGEVKQVRFRAVLNRPESIAGTDVPADGFSPVLKSYRLLLHPRGGL